MGWYPDPWVDGSLRWYDGFGWSGHTTGTPPPATATSLAEPEVILPLRVGLLGIGTLLALLLVERTVMYRLLRALDPGVVVSILIAIVVAYGIPLSVGIAAVRHTGLGTWRHLLGLRAKWVDLAIGPGVWIVVMIGNFMLLGLMKAVGIPFTSNVRGLRGEGDPIPRPLLVLLIVVIAPIVEEILFRGLFLRALRSKLPTWGAVAVQGVLFGAVHASPVFGKGNIGLVILLAWAGILLGTIATLCKRIGPSIAAHMVLNGVVAILLITGVADKLQGMALG